MATPTNNNHNNDTNTNIPHRGSSHTERRQQAPSLDVMASQPVSATGAGAEEAEATAMQESRSSSSTNSPVPNDNEESDFFLVANDSQSSLGVPNIQDMHVNDEGETEGDQHGETDTVECTPPINRLPNEILIAIFVKLTTPSDQQHCMLTCKRWARNAVDLLWHRPACSNWARHESICHTLSVEHPYFAYKDFVKRLNLSSIADKVNDGSVMPLAVCNRIERITLTNCKRLTDTGLIALVRNSHHLLALDISGDDQITEETIFTIAENCKRLQGLNVTGCTKISNEGMIMLAKNCKFMKRVKLNECSQLTDEAVLAFAEHCPNILEIDLHQCRLITNEPITQLLSKGQALRELRLTNCELIDEGAFLSLPPERVYEHLRILDLTSCVRLTDRAVERIIEVTPRLRNLVLAKCRNITDDAVYSISRLGKNLHYVHLGHCGHITDEAVKRLVMCCNRIRYIDLGCCVHLTDDSVTRLATLPKLKRIGLVKCSSITDESVYALAKANQRHRQRRDANGNAIENQYYNHSSLERVHLSYCTNLTIKSIIRLLDSCPRLTHLSLTGVPAFLREDLNQFCRTPPPEFTMHQREVFCVFSGDGVAGLRKHLNTQPGYAMYRDRPLTTLVTTNRRPIPGAYQMVAFAAPALAGNAANNGQTAPTLRHPSTAEALDMAVDMSAQMPFPGQQPIGQPGLLPGPTTFNPTAFLHATGFHSPQLFTNDVPFNTADESGPSTSAGPGQHSSSSTASTAPVGRPVAYAEQVLFPSNPNARYPLPPFNTATALGAPLTALNQREASTATLVAPVPDELTNTERGTDGNDGGDAASTTSSSPSAA